MVSCEAGQYRVRFVDWGNTERLSAGELLPLPARFASWPRQAVRARLDWRPADGERWSAGQRAAAARLPQRMVTARVTGRRQGDATVTLTDPEGRDLMAVQSPAAAPAAAPAPAAPAVAPATPVIPAAAPATPVIPAAAPATPVIPAAAPATPVNPVARATPASPAAAPAAAVAPMPAGPVSLSAVLPDNLTPLLTGEPLELSVSAPLEHPQELAMVMLDENFIELDDELNNLPAQPTVRSVRAVYLRLKLTPTYLMLM